MEDVVKNHTIRKIFIPFQKKYNINPYDMKKTYYAITDEEDVYHICVEYFSTLEKKHIYTKCFIVYLFNFC